MEGAMSVWNEVLELVWESTYEYDRMLNIDNVLHKMSQNV